MNSKIDSKEIKDIVVACEAGIGSSLMTVNAMKKKLQKAGLGHINIFHKAVTNLDPNTKFIICHEGVKKSVQAKAPEAVVVSFKFFFNDPIFDKLVEDIKDGKEIAAN
ncbi:MAG: hypothetical protein AAGU15_01545 [Anaerolineaceae bacterium]|jgi:mannitol-specific phosphotransferase system IIBC component